jgi:hypothetical protein
MVSLYLRHVHAVAFVANVGSKFQSSRGWLALASAEGRPRGEPGPFFWLMCARNIARLLALFIALQPALVAAQGFPQTLPPNTVVGRSGVGPGPAQAIPFAQLSQFMFGQIPNNTVLGNISGGAAVPTGLTAAQLTALCNPFTFAASGCVPASGGGTTNFLRADGTFATPPPSPSPAGTSCTSIIPFGGVGDGVTVNDGPFNAAYASLSSTGGCIYFPTGTYVFSSAVSKTLPNAQFSITLDGDGSNASVLQWPNTSGGMTFTASNSKNTFHIHDLTFTTSQANSGTALNLIGVGANNGQYFQSDIHNVQISGDDIGPSAPTLHYWNFAIHLHNWGAVDIANTNTFGPHQAPGSAGGGTGLLYEGDVGTSSYATLLNVSRSSFNNHVFAVLLGDFWQGITIDQANFNGQVGSTCITQQSGATATRVLLTVTNSQFNCGTAGVSFTSPVLNPTFIGNTISITGSGISGINTGASGSSGLIAIGNVFNLTGAFTGTLCLVYGGAGGIIQGNIFNQCATPVDLEAASSNVLVSQNRYAQGASSASNVNSGTGNIVGSATTGAGMVP